MTPTREDLEFWLGIMRNIKGLGILNMQNLPSLLLGLVDVAFQVPLLRRVTIEEKLYAIHMSPKIEGETFINPLLETPSIGDLRARIPRDLFNSPDAIQIERYVGEKQVSEQNKGVLKNSSGSLPWHMFAIAQDFENSNWKREKTHLIRSYRKLELVEQTDETWYDTPTFNITLLH